MKKYTLASLLFCLSFNLSAQEAALVQAIRDSNLEQLDKAIKAGANVNCTTLHLTDGIHFTTFTAVNTERVTPLIYAASQGNTALVQALVKAGAHINYPLLAQDAGELSTPLIAAAYYGNSAMVKLLVEAGANINALDSNSTSALLYALYGGKDESARFLIESKADLNISAEGGDSPIALAYVRPFLLKLMIKHGADVNMLNREGESPLLRLLTHMAYFDDYINPRLKILKIFLKAGAHWNIHHPPLVLEALEVGIAIGDFAVVAKLLSYSSQLFQDDTKPFVLTSPAACPYTLCPYKTELGAMLQDCKNIRFYCKNPMNYLKQFATYNQSNTYKQTELMWAAMFGHTDIVKILLAKAPVKYIQAQDTWGRTALMYAALADNREIVLLLLTHEAVRSAINTRSKEGLRALDYAAREGDELTLIKLLESGSLITLNTIFTAAKHKHDRVAAQLFIEKKARLKNCGHIRLLSIEATNALDESEKLTDPDPCGDGLSASGGESSSQKKMAHGTH